MIRPVAFGVASDEALGPRGPRRGRERIGLPATLVIPPLVLISHWLERIQFAPRGTRRRRFFRAETPAVWSPRGRREEGTGGEQRAVHDLNDDAREDRFDRFDEDSDSDPVGARRWLFDVEDGDRPDVVARRASRARRSSAAAFTPRRGQYHSEGGKIGAAPLLSRASPRRRSRARGHRADAREPAQLGFLGGLPFSVHWRRVVLDEGHQLGGASAIPAKLSMAWRCARAAVGHDRDADAGVLGGAGSALSPSSRSSASPVRGEPGAVEPRFGARGPPAPSSAELGAATKRAAAEARVEEEEEEDDGRFRSSDRRVVRG